MKTKRRHELQTNELADWIGQQIQTVKPYAPYLILAAVVAVAVVLLVSYQTSVQRSRQAASWNEYFAARQERSPAALETVARNYPGTPAAMWALLTAADIQLDEGIQLLYSDRDSAQDSLDQAKRNYHAVLEQAQGQPELRRRAAYGLAQVYESLGQLSEAETYYRMVVEQRPDDVLGKLAAKGLDRVCDPQTEKFYERLAEYKRPASPVEQPEPSTSEVPEPSIPGESRGSSEGGSAQPSTGSTNDSPTTNASEQPPAAAKEGESSQPAATEPSAKPAEPAGNQPEPVNDAPATPSAPDSSSSTAPDAGADPESKAQPDDAARDGSSP